MSLLGEQIATKRKGVSLSNPSRKKEPELALSTPRRLENDGWANSDIQLTNILRALGLELKPPEAARAGPSLKNSSKSTG